MKQKRTLRELRKVAETLGFDSREQVQRVFEMGGLGGNFEPSRWDEYVALLVVYAKKTEALNLKLEGGSREFRSDPCPVCGAPTRVSSARQAVLSAEWTCERGGSAHYFLNLTNRMRAGKGLPPLDYEEQDRLQKEREERYELIRKLYWGAVYGELSLEDKQRFDDAFRQSGLIAS